MAVRNILVKQFYPCYVIVQCCAAAAALWYWCLRGIRVALSKPLLKYSYVRTAPLILGTLLGISAGLFLQ